MTKVIISLSTYFEDLVKFLKGIFGRDLFLEKTAHKFYIQKSFLQLCKFYKNSTVPVSFPLQPTAFNLIKKRLQQSCFPESFVKFLKIVFLQSTRRQTFVIF